MFISQSIFTSKSLSSVKLIWTVDAQQARKFSRQYQPGCDMLLVQINWENKGGLYYFSQELQLEVLNKLGKDNYIKLPKAGTNPRGVEITAKALQTLAQHSRSLHIPIYWSKTIINFQLYQRWLEYWRQE